MGRISIKLQRNECSKSPEDVIDKPKRKEEQPKLVSEGYEQ